MNSNGSKKATAIPLVFIAGTARSGTTLMNEVLDSNSDIVGMGEIHRYLQAINKSEVKRCSSGVLISESPFWRDVRQKLVSRYGTDKLDLHNYKSKEFCRNNARVIAAILEAAGAAVAVDSSTNHRRLERLLACKQFELKVLHMVRDPRATADSVDRFHRRRSARLGIPFRSRLVRTSLRWAYVHGRVRRLMNRRNVDYLTVHYEDFARDPRSVVNVICHWIGVDFEPSMLDYWEAEHHLLDGNELARNSDPRPIKLDTRYLEHMSTTNWWLATASAIFSIRRWNYPLSRTSMRTALESSVPFRVSAANSCVNQQDSANPCIKD